jgi:hypothetical protein
MSEFPTIKTLDDTDQIINIIRNALENNCFNNDRDPLTRRRTTEVTIYENTILASPIDNNVAVGETVHDFIGLGERCKVNGLHMGKQVVSDYKTFLCVPKEFKADTDHKVYNDALENIIDNKDITILTLNENKESMSTANLLIQHRSTFHGHVTSNSVENSPDSVEGTPMYHDGSPFTPESVRNQYLDSINEINLNKLKTALSTNINNINTDSLYIQDKKQYRDSLTEIFKKNCNKHEVNVESRLKIASDHGVKHLPESVRAEKYSVFNKMYDCGITTLEGVDPKLLKLSYVYYSLGYLSTGATGVTDRNNRYIKGILILLEDNRDSNDSNGSKSGKKAKSDQITVNMKKYLFSSDSTMQTIVYRPVIDIAPNVARLCSEMAKGSIDAVEVALMKAAADRTLKIGALLSSVGLTDDDTISFLTHDIKNYYYNKNLDVKKKNGDFQAVKLTGIYTVVYDRPPENCSRRIVIYQDIQNVDPELQKLKNKEIFLTKKRETLRQEIENLNNDLKRLYELKQYVDSSNTIIEGKRRINNVNDIISEYSEYFYNYLDISSKICPDDDFNNSLSVSTEKIRKAPNLSINTKDEINEVFNSLSEKVGSCINSVNETKTMKNEQLTTYDRIKSEVELEITNYTSSAKMSINNDYDNQGKGGKNVGGRRTKRSIKVITKRKIKVKSKIIKKKSRRRNKTRRQRKKL